MPSRGADMQNLKAITEHRCEIFCAFEIPEEARPFLFTRAEGTMTRGRLQNSLKFKADKKFTAKQYAEARSTFIEAASEMVGLELPAVSTDLAVYKILGSRDGRGVSDFMACLNGAIECSRRLLDYETALLWLVEADLLEKSLRARADPVRFDWVPIDSTSSHYYFERLTAHCLAAQVFFALGNTASAIQRLWLAYVMLESMPEDLESKISHHFYPLLGQDICALKHPDPETSASMSIEYPSLQQAGSWIKLNIRNGKAPTTRRHSATFAFNGHLYVLGGVKAIEGPHYHDFWALDLDTLIWRRLPDFIAAEVVSQIVGYKMVPHADGRAFLFTGEPSLIWVFHIAQSRWQLLRTKFVPDEEMREWPYYRDDVSEFDAHCVGEKIYVFGGQHGGSIPGTDVLMELDIPSLQWRRLSGSSVPKPCPSTPGPRERFHSWVSKDQTHIFFMFGQSDRPTSAHLQDCHGAPPFFCHPYDDLWSWNISQGRWKRERLPGNAPSPRAEMACTYNPILDKVIVFGGYSPAAPTCLEDFEGEPMAYTYYADTFVADVTPSGVPTTWKQVFTCGFPTYRASSTLITDSRTGKIFLFGGYKNTHFVPSKSTGKGRPSLGSFLDLWQLRLDLPGGYFDGVDLEEEGRTAQVGPWQRCFTCGLTGPWKRCGGTCNGRVFFCDMACFKEGWREHKEKHECRKAP
ncbi:hypothetical protein FB45DRAFT_886415 [Roridomyces roridus]|uniref:Uncharacterized protein n=1 Tax=Roridomyces roridus TaxID=1738132 RepID=A0AAD7G220_9AGAR|nr:hypothetical protein FB45DRAFT_886415 [Roridomyces roridus]